MMRKEWIEVYESLGKIHDISLNMINSEEPFLTNYQVEGYRDIYNKTFTIMEYMDKEPKFRDILSICAKHNRPTDESCCCPECEEEGL